MPSLWWAGIDSDVTALQRIEPVGWDAHDNTYWLFDGEHFRALNYCLILAALTAPGVSYTQTTASGSSVRLLLLR